MGFRKWFYKKTGINLKNKHNDHSPIIQCSCHDAISELLKNKLQVEVMNLAEDLKTHERWRFPHMMERVAEKELEECAELIRANLAHAYLAQNDFTIREYCFKNILEEGLLLEFGVFKGTSINHMADILNKKQDDRLLHGFDSFEGLSNDGGGWCWEKGRFNLDGDLPAVAQNVKLYKGWIDDTLPKFLEENKGEIAFIHVDVDIYEPAKTILSLCKNRLKTGSIILFDELIGYAGWKFHEYKALNEVFKPSEYEYIGFSDFYQAAIRIL